MAELAIYKANALTTLFVMIIFSLFGASFFSWVGVGIAYFHGALKWPTAENRKVAPWGLVDILMTLMAIVFLQVLFAGAALTLGLESIDNLRDRSSPKAEAMGADEAHFPLIAQIQGELEVPSKLAETTDEGEIQEASAAPPKPNHPSMQYAAFVQTSGIVCMLLMTAWIALRCQVAWDQIGWSLRHWRKDFSLAMGATVLFVPTVYVLMAIVSSGMGKDYSHPILKWLGKTPGSFCLPFGWPSSWLLSPRSSSSAFCFKAIWKLWRLGR